MDENIETVNKYYHEGLTLKNKARKSDEFINDFKKASDSYISAAKIAEEILAKIEDENINFKVRTNALKNYYFYEGYECLYAYNYKNDLFDEALENAKSAKKHIDEAIRIVDENIDKLNDDVRTFLLQQKNNWQLSQLTVQLREVEPIGKRAMKNRDYITALDSYRKMSKLQDKAHYYVEQSNLPEVFKRTEKGNHLAAKASIAMTLAGIYIEKSSKNDYNKDILEQFLEAMHYIKLAQVSNPEQDKYKEGYESTEQNIKKILTKNKEKWFEYLTEFNNNKNLIRIMRQTDNEYYKMQNAKLEIENNKSKRFILTFGFLLSAFIILGYLLFQVALSEISWYRFLGLLVSLPVFFTIIGAFSLRSTESLKEENFIKLMELALKINIKGLSALTSNKKEES